jgi:hypothetical protein
MGKIQYALWVNPTGVRPITEQCECVAEFATKDAALMAVAKILLKMQRTSRHARVQLYNAPRGRGGEHIIDVEA